MPTKKTTSKKASNTSAQSTASKVASKKTTPSALGSSRLLPWLLTFAFGGALLGTWMADQQFMGQFDPDAGMVVIENKTWMPVDGKPITVVVLNDKDCGSACSTESGINSLKASVTPALKVEKLDINTARGQALIDQFDLVSVPQYFFGLDIEDFELEDVNGETTKFVENLPPGLLTKKEDLYYIDGARVGFKPGKFIAAPDFDMTGEPVQGDGPVTVVEFTDLQCPYCKRFHDQNKALIDQLVADGTITYVVKDFPLSFHKESSGGMHKALNCALQEGGSEAYSAIKDQIFANQASFTGIGGAAAVDQIEGYATEQGMDISACLANNSAEVQAEIQADMQEGAKYGVSGTPSVFVGTQILPGAVGPAVVQAAVKAEMGQ